MPDRKVAATRAEAAPVLSLTEREYLDAQRLTAVAETLTRAGFSLRRIRA